MDEYNVEEGHEAEHSDEDDFAFIRPTLINQLRSILDQYPDDGQILKELIQNAEDAKATRVCFLYDETKYGTDPEKLAHPELGVHQGPALYAFNDAVFADDDWKGIRMLQNSVKTKDPMKVGRFGLGFKSVFHLTDMPSVLSNTGLAFIDPHEKYFLDPSGEQTTGKKFKLKHLHSLCPQQGEPFQNCFDCNQETFKTGSFKGTIFRFPLRQSKSKLSDTLYNRQKMFRLFSSFERDAHLMLLFLKHVESVELLVRKEGESPNTIFKVQIQESYRPNIRAAREAFIAKLSSSCLEKPSAELIMPIHLETFRYENGVISQEDAYTWLISEYFSGGHNISSVLQKLCSDTKCKNIPLVGAAYLLEVIKAGRQKRRHDSNASPATPKKAPRMSKESNDQLWQDTDVVEPRGHVFCSLPLPIEQRSSTGLPVHVNGYFSISQDRQRLKLPSQGQDTQSDKDILWNQCLLQELIPRAYVNLILRTVQLCMEERFGTTPENIIQALPNKTEVEARGKWQIVLEPFYQQLLEHEVLYSPVDGNHWTHISDCVFDCLKEPPTTCSAVRKVLLSNDMKIVKIPDHVMQAFVSYSNQEMKRITPDLTRDCIVADSTHQQRLDEELKTNLTAEERRALCEFIGKADNSCLQLFQIERLSNLPLFETISHGGNMKTDFVAVKDVPMAAPLLLPIEKVNTPLLDLTNKCFEKLAAVLKVKILNQGEFITDVIFPELNKSPDNGKLEQTLDYIMNNLHQLEQEKGDFMFHLQKFPFLPNKTGKYVTVVELFDPEDEFVKSFFFAEDKFPSGIYAGGKRLAFLRQIGLKKMSSIQARDLVESAMKVHTLKASNCDMLKKKSNALVKYLSENDDILELYVGKKLVKDWLISISWMQCLMEQLEIFPDCLSVHGKEGYLDPGSLFPHEAAPLVGLVAPLCESPHGGDVLKALGQSVMPSVSQVLGQMKTITEAYQPKDKGKVLNLITSIYSHLQEESFLDIQRSLDDLSMSNWVWHGNGFTTIDKVISCQPSMDLRPYIFTLPEEMQIFEGLFNELGMLAKYDANTLVAALHDINNYHLKSVECTSTDRARDLQMAIGILNLLKDQADLDEIARDRIIIPVRRKDDTELYLMPIEECTYCDLEWLKQGIHSFAYEEKDDIIFIHPSVPINTAEALDVPTLMNRMLDADELPMTGFGQNETLTDRIKSLLGDYTVGYSIIKELVQNADDAGATVVKFLYDERSNIDYEKLLLNEGMKECQGPAFWAYNNAMFLEKDFENITKLGGATKEKEIDKIGKFGLGFNAVYNVTDVPSFISGRYLVIFDPQTTHLGNVIRDKTKPGIKVDLQKSRTMVRKLSDQFHPYQDVFGCQIDPDDPKDYKGTLFRLPLRTERQAERSEISKLSYDKHEIMKLLSMFVQGADSLLLFTQHVSRIELHHMPASGTENVMLFAVQKEKAKEKNIAMTPLLIGPTVEFDVLTRFNKHLKQSGSSEVLKTSMILNIQTYVTDNGRSFFPHATESNRKDWMLSFSYNTTQNSKVPKGAFDHGYCPYGAVAVPLKEDGEDMIPVPLDKGVIYCHLPMPTYTNLPVHINGSFAIQSNRRQLHEATVDDKYSWQADWNKFVLENAIFPAYNLLLEELLRVNESTRFEYVKLWPSLHLAHTNLSPLVKAFYGDQLKMLVMVHDGQKHITLSHAAIFKKSLSSNFEHTSMTLEVFKQSHSNLTVIMVADEVLKTMRQLNCSILEQHLYDDQRFLIEIFFPNVSEISRPWQHNVLVWALELGCARILDITRQKACIPASPNGNKLRKPSELIYPFSLAKNLYHDSEERFACFTGMDKVSRVFQELGMKNDYLAWKDIIERGNSIELLYKTKPKEAHRRTELLLRYVSGKLDKENSTASETQASPALKTLKILPLTVPANSVLRWANQEFSGSPLVSAVEAYLSTEASLLSSCCALVDADLIPQNVQTFLGLQGKSATVQQVLKQLESLLDIDVTDLRKTSPEKYRELRGHTENIYTFLNNACERNVDGHTAIKDACGQRECILIDGRFVRPCDLAYNDKDGAVVPFLYLVPDDYSQWGFLLEILDVKEKFVAKNYVGQLKKLKEKYSGEPISSLGDMKCCIQLLKGLQNCMATSEISLQDVVQNIGEIFVPNAAGILISSSELCYNDCPWIEAMLDNNFAHSDVSYPMAKALGVKTLRREMIKNHVTGIPFGQKAKLTTSIKRIIDYYPLDHEILKELIQNADDATATKIHFVLDQRTHGEERLFDESMTPLQGPALCVYNNRPFTSRDLEGIQSLGEGSKQNDPCTTGKFGIGFNSVYHLTDVPSILTNIAEKGDMLCLFDPHCCYVPGATDMEPGQRYEEIESLRSDFPDVFAGYVGADFDLQNSTIFRLPLRTKEMAAKSEISNQHISPSLVREMLKKVECEATELLLFLNYLEEIVISIIDESPDQHVFNYAIRIRLSDEDKVKRQEFHQKCLKISEQLKSHEIAIEDVRQEKVEYTLHLFHNEKQIEKWRVTQLIGFRDPECVPEDVKKAYAEGKLALLPRGGVACRLAKGSMSYTHSGHTKGKAYCSLPMPIKTMLPVHINGHFAHSFESRQHIWLPSGANSQIKLGWNKLLCKEIVATAYVDMLGSIREDIIGISEVHADLHSSETLEKALTFYERFFPEYSPISDWSDLIKDVYSYITATKAALFPCVRQCHSVEQGISTTWSLKWLTLSKDGNEKALFCEREISLEDQGPLCRYASPQSSNQNEKKTSLKEILCRCHLNITELKESLMKTLENVGIEIYRASPENVLAVFKSYNTVLPLCDMDVCLPNHIGKTNIRDIESLNRILKYCKPTSISNLVGAPLLLTNDGVLRIFEAQSSVYVDDCCRFIAEACGDLFLHKEVQSTFRKLYPNDILKEFTVQALETCLPRLLSAKYQENDELPLTEPNDKQCVLEVWNIVARHANKDSKRRYGKNNEWESDEVYDKRMTADVKYAVSPIENWCLLPVKNVSEVCVYKVKRANEIVDRVKTCEWSRTLVSEIDKLGIPQLDCLFLKYNIDVVQRLTAGFDEPLLILSAIAKVFEKIQTRSITKGEEFLEYFAEHVSNYQFSLDRDVAKKQLKSLPFYVTICNDVISLIGCAVYILPDDILTKEMDVFQNNSGIVFLKRKKKLQPLFKFLDCKFIGVAELYSQFIFEHFYLLSREAQQSHLIHLFDTYLTEENDTKPRKRRHQDDSISELEKDQLLSCLKGLCVISDEDGELKQASDFYDPDVNLFCVLIEKSRLAPSALCCNQRKWLSLLRRIGLIQNVTAEMCSMFATEISLQSQHNRSAVTDNKSKALVRHLLLLESDDKNDILPQVCSIPFIATERLQQEITELYPQYGDISDGSFKLPYISYKGSFSGIYADILWTCASILPHWADPFSKPDGEAMAQLLEMDKIPSIDLVARNFKNICLKWCSGQVLNRGNLKTVCKKSYAFMQEYGLDDGELKSSLQDIRDDPCIAVGQCENFAKPRQTTIEMLKKDEIRPYFFKVPHDYDDYKPIFLALGVTESPRCDQYVMVLDEMHRRSNREQLTPDEVILAYKALKGLFSSLDTKEDRPTINSLSLLGQNGRMYVSTRLIYNDAPWLYDRVKSYNLPFLVDLKECGLKENPDDLLARLPPECQPQRLSTCVKEIPTRNSEDLAISNEFTKKLQEKLLSEPFMLIIKRLAFHQAQISGQKLTEETLCNALSHLSTTKVYAVEDLYTHLLYEGKHVKGSRLPKTCCVKKTVDPLGTAIHHVYLKHDVEMGSDILIPFASALNSVLGDILKDSAIYLPPVLMDAKVDFEKYLNQLDVLPHPSQIKAPDPTLPRAGSIVPVELHTRLCDVEQSKLIIGNYLAVRVEGDQYRYGVVRDILENGKCNFNIGQDNDCEMLIHSLKMFDRR